MGDDVISLKIDQNIIKAALEKKMQAEITASLGDPVKLVEGVVAAALRYKVSKSGSISNYSSDNKYDFLEVLCHTTIEQYARQAVQEVVKGHAEQIKAAIIKEMKKSQRVNSIALAVANAVESSIKCDWKVYCDVKLEPGKERE